MASVRTDTAQVRYGLGRLFGCARVSIGAGAIVVLLITYGLSRAAGNGSIVDFFGYFTNLTSLIAGAVLIASGVILIRGQRPRLSVLSGVVTSCMLVVGVVYNVLVPGTGSAPPWASVVLHSVFPVLIAVDWWLGSDRAAPAWRHLWMVLPYPLCWLVVTLIRGATDGWVPYGFLLPERGIDSLAAHIFGLIIALMFCGAVVWGVSRVRPRFIADPVRDRA